MFELNLLLIIFKAFINREDPFLEKGWRIEILKGSSSVRVSNKSIDRGFLSSVNVSHQWSHKVFNKIKYYRWKNTFYGNCVDAG